MPGCEFLLVSSGGDYFALFGRSRDPVSIPPSDPSLPGMGYRLNLDADLYSPLP